MRGRNTGTDPGTGVAGFPGVLRVLALLLTLPLTLGLTGPAAAETRVALVIGINAYQNAPVLATPVNDAQAIGDALRRSNFEVEELHDPDFRTLTRSIREFGIRAAKAETALVYYAGHGVQVDHENYLIPVDARLERARDVTYEAVPLSLVLGETAQASRIGIVLLDSCRDNPFIGRVAQPASGQAVAATPGLARVDNVPRNSMVVMAAKADKVADDGIEHSPFAAAVLAHLQIPGLELGLFFRAVRDAVLKATQNRQEPYVFSSLGAEPFYFYPRPPNRPPLIGPIPTLRVAATAGPTPLGILAPTDPDLDLLSVRIVGLPRNGEVRVEGRKATLGQVFSADRFMTGTFKPDGTGFGPSGTLDLLVEDGRGGSAIGNLPIVVVPPGLPSSGAQVPGAPSPVVQAPVVQAPVAQAPVAQAPVTPSPTAQAPLPFGPPSGPGPGAAKPAAATAAPASPTPALPALSSLAEARTLALGVPCALIDIQEAPSLGQSGRLLVAGPALPGAAFDSFMRRIETPGRAADVDTEPLDPGHCAALAVMTDLVRHSRERDALRVVAPSVPVPVGGQLVISAEAIPGGALYLDLYAADGSVQHLHRGPVLGTRAEVAVTAAAPGPPGQRLLVAIATAAPLALPQRPANENEAAYLPALQHELARLGAAAVELRAEVATLSIIAASRPIAVPSRPPVSSAASRPPVQGNPRCQDIVARVTLGGNPVGRRSRHPSDQLWALMDSFVAGQSDVRYGRQPPASGHAASPGVGAGAQAGMRRHRHSGDRADSHGMRGSPQSG